MNCEYILSKAHNIADNYGRDPFFAAEQCGVLVSKKDIGTLKGAFFGAMPSPTIVINESLDEKMQTIVCAHELGHFLLHRESNISCENISINMMTNSGILEREANVFAAAYLIDTKKAIEYLKEGFTVSQAASMLETDINLLLFLLNSMGLADMPNSAFLK